MDHGEDRLLKLQEYAVGTSPQTEIYDEAKDQREVDEAKQRQ